MKLIKRAGLALVAAFALIAMAAGPASAALPEFTKEGVLMFGLLEHTLTQAPVNHFYVKGAQVRIECWSEIAHALTLKVGMHGVLFTSDMCMAEQTERKERCSVRSPGAAKGEIVTKELEGKLGYINKAAKEVGVLLKPTGASTEFIALETESGSCFGLVKSVTTEGTVIGQLKPVNKETTEGEIIFTTVAEEQAITKFEGVSGEDALKAFGTLKVGMEAVPQVVFHESEKLEA